MGLCWDNDDGRCSWDDCHQNTILDATQNGGT